MICQPYIYEYESINRTETATYFIEWDWRRPEMIRNQLRAFQLLIAPAKLVVDAFGMDTLLTPWKSKQNDHDK